MDNLATEMKGYEVGLNAGILIRKNILEDNLSFYLCLSSGLQYVSGTPNRQASGFIFSDNLFVGLNIKLFKIFYMDTRPGFRHISNAGLKKPNAWINTITTSGRFFFLL